MNENVNPISTWGGGQNNPQPRKRLLNCRDVNKTDCAVDENILKFNYRTKCLTSGRPMNRKMKV